MLHDVYIDESSQTKCRYLVLGGLILPTSDASNAAASVWMRRTPELPHGELKWGKVSRSKYAAYQRVIDGFWDDPTLKSSQFHSIVVDTHKIDHATYNNGSSDIGFNKEIYQLAMKCARELPGALFHIYPDFRSTLQRPEDLRTILNMGVRKKGDKRDWPFRRCHFRDSKTTPLLWFADLFAGAIAYELNGHKFAKDASAAKVDLSNHVFLRAGITDPLRDTFKSGKFTIWHRQLRPAGRP